MANPAPPKVVVAGCIIALAGASVFFMRSGPASQPAPPAEPVVAAPSQPAAEMPEDVPAMDPEKQPRTTYVVDFTEGLPDGFIAENIVESPEGFQLDAAPAEADGKRRGVLSSPDLRADFPLNSIVPLWKEKLEDGTKVSIEVALSPDGNTWGPWMLLEGDAEATADINPTYPDGSPNPNYGFTASMRTSFAEDLWGHFRYRFILVSGNSSTPTLSGVRIYYQDSTLGEGKPGNVGAIEQLLAKK